MRPPAIEVTHDMLEQKTFITMHSYGMLTVDEMRQKMDLAIQNMLFGSAVPWWEEPVA